uniref:PROP1-like PPR domain-containing protein n=1 Tax=Chromera velia CCMP2878 TaxID=1169474 RepID=A0A0G4HNK8_9ALVE|eukprot:Cvel_7616.t1-p1 / transcript=Cvel_7616.t1 / gene=Cvel_7616 / organism=Chromera_velia_CCMP2878 / gene_product=Pentatricopeptide repeat-containing protein, putative / transcript_product=Pentatricopeptide repeat-containing protein, putative / location=Cvel_scaffold402:3887-14881(+) / protein_length=1608 / sequence_SO=supercontig / SO=protein_coding / is_pseudo=false
MVIQTWYTDRGQSRPAPRQVLALLLLFWGGVLCLSVVCCVASPRSPPFSSSSFSPSVVGFEGRSRLLRTRRKGSVRAAEFGGGSVPLFAFCLRERLMDGPGSRSTVPPQRPRGREGTSPFGGGKLVGVRAREKNLDPGDRSRLSVSVLLSEEAKAEIKSAIETDGMGDGTSGKRLQSERWPSANGGRPSIRFRTQRGDGNGTDPSVLPAPVSQPGEKRLLQEANGRKGRNEKKEVFRGERERPESRVRWFGEQMNNVLMRARKGQVEDRKEVLFIFEQLKKEGLRGDVYIYTAAIQALSTGPLFMGCDIALELFDEMKSLGVEPNVSTYKAALNAAESIRGGSDWQRSLSLIEEMKQKSLEIDVEVFDTLIFSMAKSPGGSQFETAFKLFEEMKGLGLEPAENTYMALIKTCAKAKDGSRWREAWNLISELKEKGVLPKRRIYEMTLIALSHFVWEGSRWREALVLFEEMKQRGEMLPDLSPSICARFITAVAKGGAQWEKALEVFQDLKESGVRPDTGLYNSVLSALENAERGGKWEKIFELYEEMQRSSVKPDLRTYNILLKAMAYWRGGSQWERAEQTFAEMKRSGVQPDWLTFVALISALTKAPGGSQWQKALGYFEEMERSGVGINTHVCNRVLFALLNAKEGSKWEEALGVYEITKEKRVAPDATTYRHLINCLTLAAGGSQWEKALELFEEMKRDGVQRNTKLYGILIRSLVKDVSVEEGGQWERVLGLYEEMVLKERYRLNPTQSVVLQVACALNFARKAGQEERVSQALEELQMKGVDISLISYRRVVGRFVDTVRNLLQGEKRGHAVWNDVLRRLKRLGFHGVSTDVELCNRLLEVAASLPGGSQWEFSLLLLDHMKERGVQPDEMTWRSVIDALSRAPRGSQWARALSVFDQMQSEGCTPTSDTFAVLIQALGRARGWSQWKKALGIFQTMRNSGIVPTSRVFVCLLRALEKSGETQSTCLSVATRLFDDIKAAGVVPNVDMYNALISILAKNTGDTLAAVKMLGEMTRDGCEPTSTTFNLILNGFANTAGGSQCEWAQYLFRVMKQRGVKPTLITYSTMINVMSNACDGSKWEEALELFEEMKEQKVMPDSITYNTLIKAMRTIPGDSQWEKAIEVFEEMKNQGIQPDPYSYSNLFRCFANAEGGSKVDEALFYFQDMRAQGVQPNMRNFQELIGVFERASDLNEISVEEREKREMFLNRWFVDVLRTLGGLKLNGADFLQNASPTESPPLPRTSVPPAGVLCQLFGQAQACMGVRLQMDPGFLSRQELVCVYFDTMCEHLSISPADFLPLFSVSEILPRVLHVQTSSRLILASAFVRLQEHYEGQSSEFRGQSFGLEAFRSWYRQQSQTPGAEGWCYYLQWPGFNVPSWVLHNCGAPKGLEGGLRPIEHALFQTISNVAHRVSKGVGGGGGLKTTGARLGGEGKGDEAQTEFDRMPFTLPEEPFYVIGTCEEDREAREKEPGERNHCENSCGSVDEDCGRENVEVEEDETLQHEMAHGLFFTNEDYRVAVQAEIGRLDDDVRAKVHSKLLALGYCDDPEILEDETQAYMIAGEVFEGDSELREGAGVEKTIQEVKRLWRMVVRKEKAKLLVNAEA